MICFFQLEKMGQAPAKEGDGAKIGPGAESCSFLKEVTLSTLSLTDTMANLRQTWTPIKVFTTIATQLHSRFIDH